MVVRFNAKRVRLFAKAKGRLAKNDRADARTIAQATAVLLDAAPARRRRDLDPLVWHLTHRRQIRAWIADCTNQLERLRDRALRKTIERWQIALQQELTGLDKRLAAKALSFVAVPLLQSPSNVRGSMNHLPH